MKALLSTTYFGPVQWYQKLYRHEAVEIEQWESFLKQTYRNRCLIATTQGIQALTVPVERREETGVRRQESGDRRQETGDRKQENTIRDVRISDHGNWRHLHWNALVSAYGESPFFEYYQDDIRPFFENRWDYLFDFNEAIREKMCELLDIQPNVSFSLEFKVYSSCVPSVASEQSSSVEMNTQVAEKSTINYKQSTINSITDFREAINPNHPQPDPGFKPKPYYQVYQQKHGFLPNLSILDLLFNMGPESIFYL